MDRRPTTLIDLCFACAIAAAIVLAVRSHDRIPSLADGLVATTVAADRPQLADRVAIAAVFAEIHGPRDFTGWSIRTFERELEQRGFRRTSSTRFERRDATVDLIALPDEAAVVERALNHVLATHAVVYYNGHNFGGDLALAAPAHRLVVLDTCHSVQHYGELGTRITLIANTERAITGSIYSFLTLLDRLLARDGRTWSDLLAAMNDAALERAGARVDSSSYPEPERYVVVRRR